MIAVFDAHCDAVFRCATEENAHLSGTGGHWDLDRMESLGPMAQFFALFWDSEGRGDGEAVFREEYEIFRRECRRAAQRLTPCRTGEEAELAFAAGKKAAFLSVEGAELLGCDVKRLEEAYGLGVRAVNLTWNHANALSGSHKDHPEQGLTPRGRAFALRMQELGMLIDVSHLSDPGFWDVMELAQKPVMASHSNSRSVFVHTRNLTDRQFTAIIANKGIAGLNVYSAFLGETPVTDDTIVAHLEHFLALGGEKHVALGGDWDGCDSLPQGWQGVWDWARLYENLLRRNYAESLVQDIFFNNFMRTVKTVCTM